jgi:two-component system, NtrC family, nitrogen regulation sensor histidine kinase NtrY
MTRKRWAPRVAAPLLAIGMPIIAAFMAMTTAHCSARTMVTVGGALLLAWLWGAHALIAGLTRPVHVVANLLAAIREGDLSIRAAETLNASDAVGLVFHEMNLLADKLHRGQTEVAETSALLVKIVDEVDVAIVLLDQQQHISFLNPAAEKILGRSLASLLGRSMHEAGLARWLDANEETPIQLAGASYQVRRSRFRQNGAPRTLLALIDVQRTLRREQRASWQEIIRVLGHEINNSLTPIASIAEHLRNVSQSRGDTQSEQALGVIARRAEGLSRFMAGYAWLAKLPPPTMEQVSVRALVVGVAQLEHRMQLEVVEGPEAFCEGDRAQLEQALLNLVQNAVDASLSKPSAVTISWCLSDESVRITVEDAGLGLPPAEQLFVPFFTTKPDGNGIGLALARQVLENHGGTVSLTGRANSPGAIATVHLQRSAQSKRAQ